MVTFLTLFETKIESKIRSVDFNPLGNEFIIGGEDCKATIYNFKTCTKVFEVIRKD